MYIYWKTDIHTGHVWQFYFPGRKCCVSGSNFSDWPVTFVLCWTWWSQGLSATPCRSCNTTELCSTKTKLTLSMSFLHLSPFRKIFFIVHYTEIQYNAKQGSFLHIWCQELKICCIVFSTHLMIKFAVIT